MVPRVSTKQQHEVGHLRRRRNVRGQYATYLSYYYYPEKVYGIQLFVDRRRRKNSVSRNKFFMQVYTVQYYT